MFDTLMKLLIELDEEKTHITPTILYNEGWLLRFILNWFSENDISEHPLSFLPGTIWYSEGLLSSPFLPTYRGDNLAESYTHADGIIGHIKTGDRGKYDIKLVDPYEQFVVIEAKLFSKLAGRTTKAPGYNQVARNIACMAKVINESNVTVDHFNNLGFYVLAPEKQLNDDPSFYHFMQKDLVHQTVLKRVEAYEKRTDYENKRFWFKNYFEPLIEKIDIQLIPWEKIIESIKGHDSMYGYKLSRFYEKCLKFNSVRKGAGA